MAEPAIEKVALFANVHSIPTTRPMQLPDGAWTSKLGDLEDIEHDLTDLEGAAYGKVVLVMKRPDIFFDHSSSSGNSIGSPSSAHAGHGFGELHVGDSRGEVR